MINAALNPLQGNTKADAIPVIGSQNFTGTENLLAKLGNNSGTPNLYPVAGLTDKAVYIVMSGDIQGNVTWVQVPSPGEQCRLRAYGTGSAGDRIILADPSANSGAQTGMVRSLTGSQAPTAGGKYFRFGIAEENFVNGQTVLARFIPGDETISTSFTASGTEATDIAAIKTILEANGIIT